MATSGTLLISLSPDTWGRIDGTILGILFGVGLLWFLLVATRGHA